MKIPPVIPLLSLLSSLPCILSLETTNGELVIAMEPMIDIPDEAADDFAGFYFEPYLPIPSASRSCYDSCPCSYELTTPEAIASCQCGVETVCGGAFDADLTTGETVTFLWDASDDESKYVTIDGGGRTRIEFQAKLDGCDGDSTNEQEIRGADISYEFDFVDREGIPQSYEYNSESSFVMLGNCEIYTRLQFDPSVEEELLGLSFKRLSFSADYDSEIVVAGVKRYGWATNGYCWIRDSQNRRRLPSNDRGLDEVTNSYKLLDLPDSSGAKGTTSAGAVSSIFGLLVVALASLFVV